MSETIWKVAKYLRKSYTDDRTIESDSVQNQRKILDRYISEQPDMEVVGEFVDDGISGLVFDRPAFKSMMAEIENGNISCVITKDLSRFGREFTETGKYLRRILPAYGVRLIALGDNIDTLTDRGDDLSVAIKSMFNDNYCRDISVKTRSALHAKRKNGDYVGACPVYGYRKDQNDHNKLVIDDYPASIVRNIFRMKIEGISAARIADVLNQQGTLSPLAYKRDRGLPHPTGNYADKPDTLWSATTVIRILNDETYTGTLVQGKCGTPNYKIKDVLPRPEADWVRIEGAHEAIVSPQDFDLAARIMRLDTRTAPGGDSVYLFSGILICGCCGARMTRKAVPYKDVKHYYYYCPTTKRRGCHNGVNIKDSDLTACILESTKSHVANVASLDEIIAASDSQKAAKALAAQLSRQIEDNEKQLKKLAIIKKSLYENLVTGLIDQPEYKTLKHRYTTDETRLREAIEALSAKLEDTLAGKAERIRWMERFRSFDSMETLDRRTVISLIQSVCVVSKTEIIITFHYQDEYEQILKLMSTEVAA